MWVRERERERPQGLLGTGRRGYGDGERGRLHTYRYKVHHQNDSCIKMVSDDSHFNCLLIVWDSHKTVSTNHNFWRERRAEVVSNQGPSAYQPTTLPLGQTGSQINNLILGECYLYIYIYTHTHTVWGSQDNSTQALTWKNWKMENDPSPCQM